MYTFSSIVGNIIPKSVKGVGGYYAVTMRRLADGPLLHKDEQKNPNNIFHGLEQSKPWHLRCFLHWGITKPSFPFGRHCSQSGASGFPSRAGPPSLTSDTPVAVKAFRGLGFKVQGLGAQGLGFLGFMQDICGPSKREARQDA